MCRHFLPENFTVGRCFLYQQYNPYRFSFSALNYRTMRRLLFLLLFAAAIVRADTIYVASFGGGYIEKYNTAGTGSTFSTSISAPEQMIFDASGNLYLAN